MAEDLQSVAIVRYLKRGRGPEAARVELGCRVCLTPGDCTAAPDAERSARRRPSELLRYFKPTQALTDPVVTLFWIGGLAVGKIYFFYLPFIVSALLRQPFFLCNLEFFLYHCFLSVEQVQDDAQGDEAYEAIVAEGV